MKKLMLLLVCAIVASQASALGQKMSPKDSVFFAQIGALGPSTLVSPDDFVAVSKNGTGASSWNVPSVITKYADKSATKQEVYTFLANKKNCEKLHARFGKQFCILVVEHAQVILVIVRNNQIIDSKPFSKNNTDQYFTDDMHYLKK